MPKDLTGWLTKQQAADAIGVSTKTVEKLAKDGLLQQAKQARPGKPALVVYHPEEVEQQRQARSEEGQAFVVPDVPAVRPLAPGGMVRVGTGEKSGVAALVAALRTTVGPQDKLFLTMDEATHYSGLPRTFLEGLLGSGKLKAHIVGKHGSGFKRRIRRADLDGLDLAEYES